MSSDQGEASSSRFAAIREGPEDPERIAPLQRRQTTPEGTTWGSLNLLSLDGGGIRGYWSLKVLEKLMEHIGKYEMSLAKRNSEDRDRNAREGLHSFWPEYIPSNVTHVNKVYLQEGEKDYSKYDETEADWTSPQHIGKWQTSRRYLPCHYFDYISGASTGALIAIMLARFRMTVKDCLEEYRDLGDKIFGNPNFFRKTRGVPQHKFDSHNLKQVFEDFTYRRAEHRDRFGGPVTFPTKPGVCKALVISMKSNPDGTSKKTFLIRSYRHPEEKKSENDPRDINRGESQNLEIWQVARAATAAPTVFKPMKIRFQPRNDDEGLAEYQIFADGGFNGTNNPCSEGYDEIKALHENPNGGGAKVGVVVSVGTAKTAVRFGASLKKTVKGAVGTATDVDQVHVTMEKASENGKKFRYYRFNTHPSEALNVELDDWKPRGVQAKLRNVKAGSDTIASIEANFKLWYLAEGQNQLDECARELVETRRARIREESRWERYATVAHYYCDQPNCEAEFAYKDTFKEHRKTHMTQERVDSPNRGKSPLRIDTDSFSRTCRKAWNYPEKQVDGHGRYNHRIDGR